MKYYKTPIPYQKNLVALSINTLADQLLASDSWNHNTFIIITSFFLNQPLFFVEWLTLRLN